MILKTLKPAFLTTVVLTVITGVVYPLAITGIAQVAFSRQANGSVMLKNGAIVGSELLGQPFSSDRYFWSRPSATAPIAYNGLSSGGSNDGPLSATLRASVQERVNVLKSHDAEQSNAPPVDLVSASGSGLDPHISPEAARYQAARVAKARGMAVDSVVRLIDDQTEARTFGLLGEPRVNVLRLNLALDQKVGR